MSTGTQYQRSNGRKQSSEVVESNSGEGETFLSSSFAESQARGETDMQIATAKRYPRSIAKVRERALSLATLDEETAAGCFYVLPARSGGDGKAIEGPSVRLAEIVANSWTNLRAQTAIVDDDGTYVTAQGRCWDLETNVAISVDVRRRVTKKDGTRFSADMIMTTCNAACSIALRNVVFKIVPMALVRPIYLEARRVAIGDASTLVERRAKAIAHFAKMAVSVEQLCAAVNRASAADITVDDLGVLVGLSTSIREGDTTVDEAFPKIVVNKTPETPPATSGSATPTGAEQPPSTEKPDPLKAVRERILACDTEEAIAAISEQLSADPTLKPEQFNEINAICEGRIELLKRKKK